MLLHCQVDKVHHISVQLNDSEKLVKGLKKIINVRTFVFMVESDLYYICIRLHLYIYSSFGNRKLCQCVKYMMHSRYTESSLVLIVIWLKEIICCPSLEFISFNNI